LDYVNRTAIQTDTLVRWGRENWIVLQGKDDAILANLWFTAASNRADGSWMAWRDLGAWWLSHNPSRAVTYLESVLQEQPDDIWGNYPLARAYWATSNQNRAIQHMKRANQLISPRNVVYCAELGRMYLVRRQAGDRERAWSRLSICLAGYPQDETLNRLLKEAQAP
jgi:predicted Zn-dependent protease